MLAKHKELLQLLNAFAKTIFDEWSKNVSDAAKFNLKQHLIVRNAETHLIKTNFDPQVRSTRDLLTSTDSFLSASLSASYAKSNTCSKPRR